jgi:hypothetical protein
MKNFLWFLFGVNSLIGSSVFWTWLLYSTISVGSC